MLIMKKKPLKTITEEDKLMTSDEYIRRLVIQRDRPTEEQLAHLRRIDRDPNLVSRRMKVRGETGVWLWEGTARWQTISVKPLKGTVAKPKHRAPSKRMSPSSGKPQKRCASASPRRVWLTKAKVSAPKSRAVRPSSRRN